MTPPFSVAARMNSYIRPEKLCHSIKTRTTAMYANPKQGNRCGGWSKDTPTPSLEFGDDFSRNTPPVSYTHLTLPTKLEV